MHKGLTHLIGTGLLRAYMHGYFMDVRLYHKAKAIADPFAYEEYRKSKIRQKIEEARESRVKLRVCLTVTVCGNTMWFGSQLLK